MGNCITTTKPNILPEDDNNQRRPSKEMEKTAASAVEKEEVGRSTSTFRAADNYDNVDGEEEVRFKGKRRVVRIKLVLTQKELDRILNGGDDKDQEKDSSSAERLLMKAISDMRSRSRISEEYGNDFHWKPSLESIPEESPFL